MDKKLLVIDDAPEILMLLEAKLKESGFQVVTACDGKEGLEKISGEKIDLIILDVMMPGMDGYATLKELRIRSELKSIPVIMLTSRHAMRDSFEAMDVDYFVPKSPDTKELIEKINLALSDKILIFSDIANSKDKIICALDNKKYMIHIAGDFEEMLQEGKKNKYNAVIMHLASIQGKPDDLKSIVSEQCRNNPKLIIYSDANVKGMGENDTIKIQEIKDKWRKAGITLFYDARIEDLSFSSILKKWL